MAENEKDDLKAKKLAALKLTMDKIDKAYGKGTIMRMGERQAVSYTHLTLPTKA